MDIQRLRNLTTGRLHTKMYDVYQDLEYLTGNQGIMTHMIPRIMEATEPWLRTKIQYDRFWDGRWDTTHTGDIAIEPMNKCEQEEMFRLYKELPNPLNDKKVIVVKI